MTGEIIGRVEKEVKFTGSLALLLRSSETRLYAGLFDFQISRGQQKEIRTQSGDTMELAPSRFSRFDYIRDYRSAARVTGH